MNINTDLPITRNQALEIIDAFTKRTILSEGNNFYALGYLQSMLADVMSETGRTTKSMVKALEEWGN